MRGESIGTERERGGIEREGEYRRRERGERERGGEYRHREREGEREVEGE